MDETIGNVVNAGNYSDWDTDYRACGLYCRDALWIFVYIQLFEYTGCATLWICWSMNQNEHRLYTFLSHLIQSHLELPNSQHSTLS